MRATDRYEDECRRAPRPELRALEGKRILVVEDDEWLAFYIVDILTECGCEISGPVPSGPKALEAAGAARPDLALIDIGLKGQMDGISAALELRARFAVPAVFLSGTVDPLVIERARTAAPLDFLHKPYLPAQLESVLRKAFDEI